MDAEQGMYGWIGLKCSQMQMNGRFLWTKWMKEFLKFFMERHKPCTSAGSPEFIADLRIIYD